MTLDKLGLILLLLFVCYYYVIDWQQMDHQLSGEPTQPISHQKLMTDFFRSEGATPPPPKPKRRKRCGACPSCLLKNDCLKCKNCRYEIILLVLDIGNLGTSLKHLGTLHCQVSVAYIPKILLMFFWPFPSLPVFTVRMWDCFQMFATNSHSYSLLSFMHFWQHRLLLGVKLG